jgi:hypothetical protein
MNYENMSVAVIQIPEEVKENGRLVAEAESTYYGRDYETEVIQLMVDWAFSEYCVRNRLWHEWQDDDDGVFTCEARGTGQLLTVAVHGIYAGKDFDESREGLRTSFHYVHTNPQIDVHVLVRYDGKQCFIYGGAAAEHIKRKADVYELRPMVLNLPADRIPVDANLLAIGLMQTDEEQHPLDGLLD